MKRTPFCFLTTMSLATLTGTLLTTGNPFGYAQDEPREPGQNIDVEVVVEGEPSGYEVVEEEEEVGSYGSISADSIGGPTNRNIRVKAVQVNNGDDFLVLTDVDALSMPMAEELRALLAEQDEVIGAYKKSAEGSDQHDALRERLTELLSKEFDLRQQKQEQDVARMEKKLAELRAMIAKRNEHRELIIENRLAKLVGGASVLEWEGSSGIARGKKETMRFYGQPQQEGQYGNRLWIRQRIERDEAIENRDEAVRKAQAEAQRARLESMQAVLQKRMEELEEAQRHRIEKQRTDSTDEPRTEELRRGIEKERHELESLREAAERMKREMKELKEKAKHLREEADGEPR